MLANSRMDEVSHIQFNPLFDMSLSRSDLNFEVEGKYKLTTTTLIKLGLLRFD